MKESQLEKTLATLTNFGAAEYRRGYTDALRIAEQVETWLNPAPGSDVTIAEVRVWASSLIAKARKEMAVDEQD